MLNRNMDRTAAGVRVRAVIAWVVALVAGLAAAPAAAQSGASAAEPAWRWQAELVALDESADTLTVRARAVAPAALAAVADAAAGAEIVIVWSGYGNETSGILAVTRGGLDQYAAAAPPQTETEAEAPVDGAAAAGGADQDVEQDAADADAAPPPPRYLLPAAFVAADGPYLTFRVPLPAASRSAMRTLTPGTWMRGVSPPPPVAEDAAEHAAADAGPAVLAVEAYAPSGDPPPAPPRQATYRWTGELLTLDEATDTLTVRAPAVTSAALAAVAGAAEGAPIVIRWSGHADRASGIRSVQRDDGSGLWGSDRLLLRAAFVAADGPYLTFRAPLPAASRAAVRALTPGAWATVTSPHHPADAGAAGAVQAVAAYAPPRDPGPALSREATYRWAGELVTLDEGADTLTVRARAVTSGALAAVADAAPGTRLVIRWSGDADRASGIRSVRRDDRSGLWGSDRLLLRAAFVAADGPYLTFRTPLPAASRAAVRALTRGAWAHVTSPHHPADAGTAGAVRTVTAYVPARHAAPALSREATYRWTGELVTLDEGADTLTVRARAVTPAALAAVADAPAGARIVIRWSGRTDRANGIRAVRRDDGSGLWGSDRFLLRAAFVAADGPYLTFRTPLPAASRAVVRALTRGAWAHVTSPHHPADAGAAGAVRTVAAYVPARAPHPTLARGATYRWHGELVTLDDASATLTVQARAVTPAALAAVADAPPGTPIVIRWSGFADRASGIRAVRRDDGSGLWGSDRFLLRAAFVAAESSYLTFRAPLPTANRGVVQALAQGAWASVTSPHHPADAPAGSGLLAVEAFAPAGPPRAEPTAAGRTYVWPAELVALHAADAAVTVSAPVERHVLRYVDRFTEGDPVMLIWTPSGDGEVAAIRYLEHEDQPAAGGVALTQGYILPAGFVAADPDRQRLVFRTTVPAGTFIGADIRPGARIEVASRFDRRGAVATVRAVGEGPQAQN